MSDSIVPSVLRVQSFGEPTEPSSGITVTVCRLLSSSSDEEEESVPVPIPIPAPVARTVVVSLGAATLRLISGIHSTHLIYLYWSPAAPTTHWPLDAGMN